MSNISVTRFSLDVRSPRSQVTLHTTKHDTARTWKISLYDGGKPIDLKGLTPYISIVRPDGTDFQGFCYVENDSEAVYRFSEYPDTTAVAGEHSCQLTLNKDELEVTFAEFYMVVSERILDSDEISVPTADKNIVQIAAANERARIENENTRKSNENVRKSNEEDRKVAEETRKQRDLNRNIDVKPSTGGHEIIITNPDGTKKSFMVEDGKDGNIDLPISKGSGTNAVIIGDSNNVASGDYSVAEGSVTTASDHYAHAEGYGTKATKGYAHAEGQNTTASATAAHSEGNQTIASGARAHAEGYVTTASGGNSHAEGARTQAIGSNSHAEGEYTEAKGDYAHAEGRNTIAGGRLSHAEGYKTEVYGEDAHIEGLSTNRASSIVSNLTLDTDENAIKNAWNNDKFALVLNHHAHGEGRDNLVFGECSHAEGRNNIAGNKTSGWYAHAEGKNTTATGNASHSEGINTKATGAISHAEGSNTTASGDWSHSEGAETQATNVYAHAEGYGTVASAEASHASGYNTIANKPAQFVCGSCNADDPTAMFIVGASESKSSRKNCFSSGYDGSDFYLKIGSTKITEAQLKKLLNLI